MSERKDPAADSGKPADDRDEPVKDRPEAQTATAAAPGSAGQGEESGPAVPGEPASGRPAESASPAPQGDPARDDAAPGETRTPGGTDASTAIPPAAPSGDVGVGVQPATEPADTAAQKDAGDSAAKDSSAAPASGDEQAAGTAETSGAGEGAKEAGERPAAAAPDTGAAGADKPAEDRRPVLDSVSERPEAPEAERPEAGEEAKETVRRYDCTIPEQRAAGLEDAAAAVRQGRLVVIPTDTVYGIGADAFTPSAVNALLAAKGRGRDMPVPVLVGTLRAANALVDDLGPYGQDLIDAFWPGPLTIIGHATPSLRWDLGETKGTVALRMPLHAVALDLLKETGPMAVSSANRSGAPPATTAAEAEEQLGDSVAVYLDGGRCTQPVPSTIVDLTTPVPRVLRKGAIPVEKLKNIVGYVATDD